MPSRPRETQTQKPINQSRESHSRPPTTTRDDDDDEERLESSPSSSPRPPREEKYAGLLLSTLAGLSTSLGGVLVVGLLSRDRLRNSRTRQRRLLGASLAFAAGVMTTVSVFDLYLPLVRDRGVIYPTLALCLGIGLFFLLSRCLENCHHPGAEHDFPSSLTNPSSLFGLNATAIPARKSVAGGVSAAGGDQWRDDDDDDDDVEAGKINASSSSFESVHHHRAINGTDDSSKKQQHVAKNLRIGLLMFISLTCHNAPEGLLVVTSSRKSEALGLTMAVAIAVHNISEGIVIAAPIYVATNSRWKPVLATALSGLSEPLGALLSILVLSPYYDTIPDLVNHALTVVAGIMLGACAFELVPEARVLLERREFWSYATAGGAVMMMTMMVI